MFCESFQISGVGDGKAMSVVIVYRFLAGFQALQPQLQRRSVSDWDGREDAIWRHGDGNGQAACADGAGLSGDRIEVNFDLHYL